MRTILLAAVALTLTGCPCDPSPPSVHGGRFSLHQTSNLKGVEHKNYALDGQGFNIGTIKASQSEYFVISNSGDADITGITFSSGGASVIVTPIAMDVLPVGGAVATPEMRVALVHGVQVNGLGLAAVMTPGDHEDTVTIAGTSLGQPVTFSLVLDYSVDLMAVDLVENGVVRDWNLPDVGPTLGKGGLEPVWSSCSPSLRNVGNVDINYVIRPETESLPPLASGVIPVGETFAPEFTQSISVALDANGTTTDPVIQRLGTDGVLYVVLERRADCPAQGGDGGAP